MKIVEDVYLSPGRERSLNSFHPWVFSRGLAKPPTCEPGSLVRVFSHDKAVLGIGYYNPKTSIAIRMISFRSGNPDELLRNSIEKAVTLRKDFFASNTNCYRVINAEGDGIPGLIIDRYNDVLVMQVTTLGIEKIKNEILTLLQELLAPRAIVERSEAGARKEEGLSDANHIHVGEVTGPIEVLENGISYNVDVIEGQKTGFFLDQREMRYLLGTLSNNKSVLNCFCYSGGFSLAAAKGGAQEVVSVDISKGACELTQQNLILNSFSEEARYPVVAADVFEYLRKEEKKFDIIILDPPAFVKRKESLRAALHGYRDINRIALSKLKPGGLLFTFSCSHYVKEEDFEACVFQAARSQHMSLRVLSKHRRALDHPTALSHAEGSYLKGLVVNAIY